jgi:hypothetical protein
MMTFKKIKYGVVALASLVAISGTAMAGMDDVGYAGKLWTAMEAAKLVGPNAIHSTPYEGAAPHGAILETLDSIVSVNGHEGAIIVKRNYGPDGIDEEMVANERDKHLKAVTVMFRRDKGYDADNKDWFWVKYAPNGSVMKNPAGMALAGMVGKGMDKGCIACHKGAGGGDLVFNNDFFAKY